MKIERRVPRRRARRRGVAACCSTSSASRRACPGAQLQEVEGDEYRGVVKVKVGPITAQYKGAAKLRVRRRATHIARDRGRGPRHAWAGQRVGDDHGASLAARRRRHPVNIDTDLTITGKVAQFGRGVMADVSSKLLGQFVANLERDVLLGPPRPRAAAAEDAGRATRRRRAESTGAGPARSTAPRGRARRPVRRRGRRR